MLVCSVICGKSTVLKRYAVRKDLESESFGSRRTYGRVYGVSITLKINGYRLVDHDTRTGIVTEQSDSFAGLSSINSILQRSVLNIADSGNIVLLNTVGTVSRVISNLISICAPFRLDLKGISTV